MKTKIALAFVPFFVAPLLGLVGAGVASAQVEVYAPPPPTYVATVDPVYYNGQPTYWYGNHWYWRDGGGHWQYYTQEPQFLHDHRFHGQPDRHYDEHRGNEHRGDDHRGGRR